MKEVVDHHVAHHMDAPGGLSLPQQVLLPAFLGHEKAVRDRVRHHAVDLFRHGHVEAAQARLDMGHPDQSFLATMLQASVEFTSPTTTTQSGSPPCRPSRRRP